MSARLDRSSLIVVRVFMLDDGTDTGTAMRCVDDARMALEQAQAVLTGYEATVASAQKILAAAVIYSPSDI